METASDILRRLLNLETSTELKNTDLSEHELSEDLSGLKFRLLMVDAFLYLLGRVYSQKPKDFQKVLLIKGRKRKHFAESREEIEGSGDSTQTKQIPGSSYWVMTNSASDRKVKMLKRVLVVLNYSKEAISDVESELKPFLQK